MIQNHTEWNSDHKEEIRGLPTLIDSLKTVSSAAESDFMLLGNELQTVYTVVTDMTGQMLETIKRISGDSEESVLSSVGPIVNKAMEEIKACQDEVSTNIIQINNVIDCLGELFNLSGEIKKFARFLNAVALNVYVENSRTDESIRKFSIIAEEIRELSKMITDIANRIYDHVKIARETHILVHKKISNGMNELESLKDDAHQAVEESVNETEQLMTYSRAAIKQAGTHSQKISQQVGDIVVGIQFHDNMRQQIEHIIQKLNDAMSMKTEKAAGNDGGEKDGNVYGPIIGRQAAELGQLICGIDNVYESSVTAFEVIGNEVDGLVRSLVGMSPLGSKNDPGGDLYSDGPFSELKSALMGLNMLMEQGRQLFEEIQDMAAHASDIANKLSELLKNVRNVSHETRNKALNSIISAQRLGDKGSTLMVLAHEMKDLSAQSNKFADQVENIVESIEKSARYIAERKLAGGADITDKETIENLEFVVENIFQEYQQFRLNSFEAIEQAKGVKGAISNTSVNLDFFKELSEVFSNHCRQLGEMGEGTEYVRGIEGAVKNEGHEENNLTGFGVIGDGKNADNKEDNRGFGDNVELF